MHSPKYNLGCITGARIWLWLRVSASSTKSTTGFSLLMNSTSRALLSALIGLLAFLPLPAQTDSASGEVTGSVSDENSRARLGSVSIEVEGETNSAVSDREGEFTLRHLSPGDHVLVLNYIGASTKRVPIHVEAGKTLQLELTLGDVILLDSFKVEAARSGQARALNEQRAAQNLTAIVSSDLTGQFPDKTIADAVKRLPGITVETDTDTGGSEGRYITVRGMSAAFNAVSVNGVRVGIANADDTISRQVPLDVISAKSADTIVVTKSLTPDMDGDSIGGAVDIRTRSALDRDGPAASAEFAVGYKKILTDYDNYRFKNPNYEGAASFSTVLDKDRKWAIDFSANLRRLTSQKQRVSVYDWIDVSETSTPQYLLEGLILQDFFDHLTNFGTSAAVDFRPTDEHKFKFTAAYNQRQTDRGRQRQVIWFDDEVGYDDFYDSTPTATGDTLTHAATTYNSFERQAREFHEIQSNTNLAFTGESKVSDLTLGYLAGYNRGQYHGDPGRDIWARFQTGYDSTNTYTINPGDAYFPTFTTSEDRNDPSLFKMRSIDLSSDVITDKESDLGLDAKYDTELGDHPAFVKAGVKGRFRDRDRDHNDRFYTRNRDWTLSGYDGDSSVPSLVADYRAKSLVDGRYDYGFYLDPERIRSVADQLIAKGLLESDGESDINNKLYSYTANENILAAYLMGQVAINKLTITTGVRAERTKVKFDTYELADGADLTPISPTNSYTNFMPGLHLRYDVTKKLAVRASYNRSISRPTFSDLNPRELIDHAEFTVSRGNIHLKPVTSDNIDLSTEYYISSVGSVSASVFYKKLRNNIYSPGGFTTVIDGDTYDLDEPRNAEGGHVQGFELGYEQQLKFLPAPLDGFGLSANWTHADSSVKTGYASVPEIQLFDQVKNTVNAGFFYDKGRLRFRAAWLFRSKTIPADYGINPTHPELGRVIAGGTTLDLTASYRFARQWTVFAEFQNVLDTPGRSYDGNESLRLDYNEYTSWYGELGIRWNL